MAAGRGGAYAPGRQQMGAKRGCGNFSQCKIYINYVSSVEAGIGMDCRSMQSCSTSSDPQATSVTSTVQSHPQPPSTIAALAAAVFYQYARHPAI